MHPFLRSVMSACAVLLSIAVGVPASAQMMGCTRYFPAGTKALIFSSYGPKAASPVRLETQDNRTTRQLTVDVAKYEMPLVIVVASTYHSTLWRFNIDPATKVAAIIVFGRHSQGVANVPLEIAVGFSTEENGVQNGCPKYANSDKLTKFVRDDLGLVVLDEYAGGNADCLPGPCRDTANGGGFWSMLFGGGSKAPTPEPPIRTSYGAKIDPPG